MTEQTTLTLISACFGFVAAIYFCIGSAFTSHKKLVALSKTYWGYNLEVAKATVSQSTQYAIGGLLLLVSFVLQVVAIQASSTNPINLSPMLASPLIFVFLFLAVLGSLSCCFYYVLNKYRSDKVEKQLKKDLP